MRDTLGAMGVFWRIAGWLKRIPLGLWAAGAAALTILGLYLRGQRLHAELAAERLKSVSARAKANAARHNGRAEGYRAEVAQHEMRIDVLEQKRTVLEQLSREDSKRLATLPPDEITEKYLELVRNVPKGE